MLSWSSSVAGSPAEIGAIVDGSLDAGLPHAPELVAFADAVGGFDDGRLATARDRLVAATDEAFMIDAAAVVANFEMMTRVADGTGARFPGASAESRAELDRALGIGGFTSAR